VRPDRGHRHEPGDRGVDALTDGRSGDELLGPWLADPGRAGIFTDFDGTLSPIVDDPDRAVPLPGAVDTLGRLAVRYGRVGVVSGRSVRYLDRRLATAGGRPHPGLVLSGLYGLERVEDGELSVRDGAGRWAQVVDEVDAAARAAAPEGVTVEHKGLVVTLHARRAPQHLGWIESYAAETAQRTGLRAGPGRMLVELRPPLDVDKGTIVTELATGLAAVAFFGDDVGDLPAFGALTRLRRTGVATLAVAARSAESPTELLDAADLVVDGPAGILRLLTRLAD
jgi:trehalose 6-phosphate phosphatase